MILNDDLILNDLKIFILNQVEFYNSIYCLFSTYTFIHIHKNIRKDRNYEPKKSKYMLLSLVEPVKLKERK